MGKSLEIEANKGKNLNAKIDSKSFIRIPVKTHLIGANDNIVEVASRYLKGTVNGSDIVFISEKVVAITQGRAIPLDQIKPRRLATFLAKFVTKTPAGIGIGMPETMEMALRECGVLRVLLAAIVGFITKTFLGKKGCFYRVAGPKARSIDGPTKGTIPPYNKCVVLGPKKPNEVARQISEALGGVRVVIVDINDLVAIY